jgi:phosphopantothenoylcysteine synthetase/decarboxylase
MTSARDHGVLYLVVCAAPPAMAIDVLVGLLQRGGWTVCVITTPRAALWVDSATLATQTGYPVRSDHRAPTDADTLPPADLIAVVPATFNTINKWSAGISDTLALGLLNEAIGLRLPTVVAPYAKPTLAAHPAFATSLENLRSWGVTVLDNEVVRPRAGNGVFEWQSVVDAISDCTWPKR